MLFKDELLNKFMIRKNKKQKDSFINWVKENINEYDVSIEKHSFNTRNIVIGDVEKAKVIFTAHYDTCANMIIPNFITPLNIFVYLLYQVVLLFLLIAIPSLACDILEYLFPNSGDLGFVLFEFVLFFELYMLMFGPANKTTVNDNTSGVLTILEMIKKVPTEYRDKVAFVLFDYEEIGLIGSSCFAGKHKDIAKNTLLINLDCVSDGDKALFVYNKNVKGHLELLKSSYTETDNIKVKIVSSSKAIYPSDQANFKCGVGVCTLIRGKFFDYIDKIHTKKDTVLREENIHYFVEKSIKLIEDI